LFSVVELDAQRRGSSKQKDTQKENVQAEGLFEKYDFNSKADLVEHLLKQKLTRTEKRSVVNYRDGKELAEIEVSRLVRLLDKYPKGSEGSVAEKSGRKQRSSERSTRSSRSSRSRESSARSNRSSGKNERSNARKSSSGRKTRQSSGRSASGRRSGRTADTENDTLPSFLAEIENGNITEHTTTVSSGRKASGRRTGRLAGQGQAAGTTALQNFSDPTPNKYIWDRIRRWMAGTPEEVAQACLDNIWCDAFYTYTINHNGNTYYRGALCDDVDPFVTWNPSSRYTDINAYTYKIVGNDAKKQTVLDKRLEIKNKHQEIVSRNQTVVDRLIWHPDHNRSEWEAFDYTIDYDESTASAGVSSGRVSRSGRTSDDAEIPEVIQQIQNGVIEELAVSSSAPSSGRKRSGRIAGEGRGSLGDEASDWEYFIPIGTEKYISGTRRWMRGTPDEIATACLNASWCDAFYVYDYINNGVTTSYGALCDDVDPTYNWNNSDRYQNIEAFVYFERVDFDDVIAEMNQEIEELDAIIAHLIAEDDGLEITDDEILATLMTIEADVASNTMQMMVEMDATNSEELKQVLMNDEELWGAFDANSGYNAFNDGNNEIDKSDCINLIVDGASRNYEEEASPNFSGMIPCGGTGGLPACTEDQISEYEMKIANICQGGTTTYSESVESQNVGSGRVSSGRVSSGRTASQTLEEYYAEYVTPTRADMIAFQLHGTHKKLKNGVKVREWKKAGKYASYPTSKKTTKKIKYTSKNFMKNFGKDFAKGAMQQVISYCFNIPDGSGKFCHFNFLGIPWACDGAMWTTYYPGYMLREMGVIDENSDAYTTAVAKYGDTKATAEAFCDLLPREEFQSVINEIADLFGMDQFEPGTVPNGGDCLSFGGDDVDDACVSGYCYEGKCIPKAGDGDICGHADDGSDFTCDAGRYCAQYAEDEYRCCDNASNFESLEEWCVNLDDDENCDYDRQCQSNVCDNGKCFGKKADGELCVDDGDDDSCISGQCAQYRDNEYRCCPGGNSYDHATNFEEWCDELPEGTEVWDDSQCASSAPYRINGKCSTIAPDGAACADGDDDSCQSGKCGQYRDDEYKCCSSMSTWWAEDWCTNLPNGTYVYDNDQCVSRYRKSNGTCGPTCTSSQYRNSSGDCSNKKGSMANDLSNYTSVTCSSDNQCQSGICSNSFAGGTYYCWPKEKCGGAGCYGTTHVGLYDGNNCRYDSQCNGNWCGGNAYGIQNGVCD